MNESSLPLVSILIPSYNRPEYLRIAIINALSQTYKNIEIIVCDDSTNDEVQNVVYSFIKNHPQVKYFKNDRTLFLENWHRCFELASGEYINYLMDDDAFHLEKIEKMMFYYLNYEDITLVTSFRQLIGEYGNLLPPIPATVNLYNEVKILDGKDLGNYVLNNSINYIGEGTTVLFRKKDLKEKFGTYHGKQYCCINDVAAWLSLLAKGKAVYIPEALSYFRIHQNQNSHSPSIVSTAFEEWLDIMIDSRKDGFLESPSLFKRALLNRRKQLESVHFLKTPEWQQKKQMAIMRINAVLNTI